MEYTCKKTELYHYGIKGQQWGVRRYQNEDGSLTPEGMKRYGHAKSAYVTRLKLNKDVRDDVDRVDSMYKEQEKAIKATKKEAKLSGDKETIKAARETAKKSMAELNEDRAAAYKELGDIERNIYARSVSRGKAIGEAALTAIGGVALKSITDHADIGVGGKIVGNILAGSLAGVATSDIYSELLVGKRK